MMTNILKLLKKILLVTAITEIVFAPALLAAQLPFYYVNSQNVIIRNNNLQTPRTIEAGSTITIDPAYLKENLGTETPTQEQVQKLLLNPGEASNGKIVTQGFFNFNSKRERNDYFFDVIVKTKSGEEIKGKMALQAYYRMGVTEIHRVDGANPLIHQSDETTEKIKTLVELNKNLTEGQVCPSCAANPPAPTQPLSEIVRAIETSPETTGNSLWIQYQSFARDFTTRHPDTSRSRAGYYKRLFLTELFEKFGLENSARILTALTGFAEAPYRSSNETQLAEIAAVQKVIRNRAAVNFRSRSRTLRDIGIAENANATISNILADWQFSAWNDRDNNLMRMIKFNPDTADLMTKRKMLLSFEAQQFIDNGQIQFTGRMNDPRMFHYHANYVNPNWDRTPNRLSSAVVTVNGTSVDVSRQRGARHIFYVGIN